MTQRIRPERVGEEIRQQLGEVLAREVHDPAIGFITLTRVKVSPDLQLVRVYYTVIGDDRLKQTTQQGLERAMPFLRRQIGARVRLRRVPELRFEFDRSVEHQDRIERILLDLEAERKARGEDDSATPPEGTEETEEIEVTDRAEEIEEAEIDKTEKPDEGDGHS